MKADDGWVGVSCASPPAHNHRGRCLGPISGGLGGASCLLLASPCWTWDCQKVGALGQRWEDGRGRGLGLLPPHCVGHGFMLQGTLVLSLGAKVDSKQTLSQGKASSDRFDPGSFFLPCFWKGGLGEGNDVAQLRIGVGLGGALLPPHGRRRARSLDDGILVKLRRRSWVCHAGVTRSRLGPPVKPRDQRYRTRHSVRRSSQG
jgi:hypothetical protein